MNAYAQGREGLATAKKGKAKEKQKKRKRKATNESVAAPLRKSKRENKRSATATAPLRRSLRDCKKATVIAPKATSVRLFLRELLCEAYSARKANLKQINMLEERLHVSLLTFSFHKHFFFLLTIFLFVQRATRTASKVGSSEDKEEDAVSSLALYPGIGFGSVDLRC